MNKKKKNYILENIRKKTDEQLSEETGMKKRKIRRLLKRQKIYEREMPSIAHPSYCWGTKRWQPVSRAVFIILLAAILILGMALRLSHLNVANRTPDETIYTLQAKHISEKGIEGLKMLLEEHRVNKDLWIYPPPTRIGYLLLCSAIMKMADSTDIQVISYVSSFFSILSLLLMALIGLRFTNRWITLGILLLMSTSPMDLAIARRAWQDSTVSFFSLLLIYLCYELTSKIKNKLWHALFFLVAIYSLLIKDITSLLVYGLLAAGLLWIISFKERSIRGGILFASLCLAAPAMSILITGVVTGDALSIFKVLDHMAQVVATNTYAVQCQNGPWYYFIHAFWILTPGCTFLCAVGILGVIFHDHFRRDAPIHDDDNKRIIFTGTAYFIMALLTLFTLPPHLKNLRYVSPLYGPFYLMAGLGLWYAASFLRSKLSNSHFCVAMGFFAGTLMAIAIMDYRNFNDLFINKDVRDLTIWMLKNP